MGISDRGNSPAEGVADHGVDWNVLRANARRAMQNAYAPYSNFAVGAAGVVDDGRIVVGCNVENVSYGLSLCAECGMVSNLFSGGGGRLLAVSVCDAGNEILMPCGRCRQLLLEHGGPGLLIDTRNGAVSLSALLPNAFGPDDIERVSGGSGA
ncbi:cytidine deaminase [Antrihabitans sp. YC2-6]|uniref:cytidine deaminase n=1 Tax=Antrihabitans sp. YC2-6 TaxID=2799498 RepID=UPI0018F3F981|nr:cytidine deaminase [Antrihabitans sp. YC2-6]MBJ8347380.1 cytidine deaminase [Antrihabitans sp. YC2-6]